MATPESKALEKAIVRDIQALYTDGFEISIERIAEEADMDEIAVVPDEVLNIILDDKRGAGDDA